MKSKLFMAALAVSLLAVGPAQAAFFPVEVIDGPSADINGGASGAIEVDVAPDGTGAIAYVKNDGGVSHIFVSLLANGTWGAPERVDDGLALASDRPTVAVANGGRVAVAFANGPNGEDPYGVVKPDANGAFGAPEPLEDNPGGTATAELQLDMGPTGVAYAVWRENEVGTDIHAARLDGQTWTLLTGSLNTDQDNQVSNQGNGPETAVGVDGAGNGVILWNEVIGTDRKAYLRRLTGTTPGSALEVTVDSFEGQNNIGGDVNGIMVDLDVAGDGSAVAVMREDFDVGGNPKARAIGRRLVGDSLGAPFSFDNQAFPDFQDNAEMPEVDLAPDGTTGLVAAQRNLGNELFAGLFTPGGVTGLSNFNPVDTENYSSPAVAAGAGGRGLVAMARDTSNDVVARYFDGTAFGAETVISNPGFGNAVWFPGYVDHTSADDQGNVAIALYQGAAADTRVVVGVFDAPPSAPVGTTSEAPTRDATPDLAWSAAADAWGGVQSYAVTIDGNQVGTTPGTTFTAATLSNGDHTWTVTASDKRGQTTSSAPRRLVIDTKKPSAKLKIKGKRRRRKKVKFIVRAKDANGIARVQIAFGDKKKATKRKLKKGKATFSHRYKKAKRYKVKVTVTDKVGNKKVVRKKLRIKR